MLTIGEVAARTGLRASALRYYEAEGLLPVAARSGGKRVYDASILDRLATIELAKRAGFELKEIRDLLARVGGGRPARIWSRLGAAKRAKLDEEIARLATMRAVLSEVSSCGCATLTDCGRRFEAARSRFPELARAPLKRAPRAVSKPRRQR